ncbi:MAG: hypothetical protein QNJ69_12745 [Gammaproteobacteria bacterium]|nr:hypothetical protein [Gammaproteobacteria bacterium]
MKRILNIALALVISVTLASCVTTQGPRSVKTQINYPFWVENPTLNGFIGISTDANVQSMGGLEGQRRVAMLKAKAEYSRIKKTSIEATTEITLTGSGEQSLTDQRRLSSGTAFRFDEAFVKEEWIHPETQALYIWVLVPEGNL